MIREGSARSQTRATWLGAFVVLAACLPLAIAGSVVRPADPAAWALALGFGLLALAALLRPIEPAPGEKFTLAGAVMFFGALTVPGMHGVLALTTAALAAKVLQRASIANTVVNTAKVAGAVGAAGIAGAGPLSLFSLMLSGAAYLAVTLGAVAAMIAATRSVRSVGPFLLRELLPSTALVCLGAAAAVLWARDPAAVALLLPPLALVEVAARARRREREAVAALERLNEAQRAFAADAAHELRTPLATLIGELAYVRAASLSHDELAALEGARRQATLLSSLVDRLLELSRSEALSRPDGSADVGEAVARVTGRLGLRSGVALEVSVSDDLRVALPPELLDPVLRDLLENAAAHTFAGHVRVEARRDGAEAEIVVADTGSGIPAAELPRVFDRFYRGGRSRSIAPGTGLGLSIVRSIVEAASGTIRLESELDRGTTVRVNLPAA